MNEWEQFIAELRAGRCCLLLGPEIRCMSVDNGNVYSVLDSFSNMISEKLQVLNVEYNNAEKDFHYVASKYIGSQYSDKPERFEKEIVEFRESRLKCEPEFFKDIARLPFNAIVNMVPDSFLATQCAAMGYEFVEDFYDYSAARPVDLTDEMQLIYNLFGTYDYPDSVAVTEKRQLSLLKNLISGSPAVPDKITFRFSNKRNSFLFLGFNFNDWHFRMIMDVLKIPKPNNFSFSPKIGEGNEVAFLTKEFYSESIGLTMMEQTTEDFVATLTTEYQRRYGSFDRKLPVLLDYHDNDLVQFQEVSNILGISGIRKRISTWDKRKLHGGDQVAETERQLEAAEVYIPFLSNSFLQDTKARDRVVKALDDPNKKVIPVIANYCPWQAAIPNNKKALITLPRNQVPLSSSQGADLSKICNDLVRIINCVVR